ncbi:GNAT family N-acetyltransferase [Pelagibacterium lacus]|uniref:GNAT family N-acetyltransferase n=1 Tax=Pelagibacterium lacus TaxID=2282655 RepID=UPI001314E822|nr:GNAT family N-acetyltransferase [Pelagibacterium lacus]
MTLAVRQIGPGEAIAYREIRLTALDGDPAAFSSDAATERARDLDWYRQSARETAIFVAFRGEMPIGMAGLFVSDQPKTRHIGTVFGVYVRPEARQAGVAALLMEAVIAHAAGSVAQLHLGVAADNIPALALYHRLGFQTYGTEPRALRIEDRYIDEHLMVLFLDKEDRL